MTVAKRKKDVRKQAYIAVTDRLRIGYKNLLEVYEESKDDEPNYAKMMDGMARLDVELARARMEIEGALKARKLAGPALADLGL